MRKWQAYDTNSTFPTLFFMTVSSKSLAYFKAEDHHNPRVKD
jgi:hypothetical protein